MKRELLDRLWERGNIGLDRSPGDPLCLEAYYEIKTLVEKIALLKSMLPAGYTYKTYKGPTKFPKFNYTADEYLKRTYEK